MERTPEQQRAYDEETARLSARQDFKARNRRELFMIGCLPFLALFGILLVVAWVMKESGASGSSRPAPVDYSERIRQHIREAEDCGRLFRGVPAAIKSCVQSWAADLPNLYRTASQRDGVDRSVVIDFWAEVARTGELGYIPRPAK